MEYLLFSILVLVSIAGVILAVLQLPGTWLILAAAVGYDWYHGWDRITWPWLVGLAVFATLAEVVDSLAGVVAARKAGASRRAAMGALIGGFAGMLVFSIPVPILGTVIGGLLGCFLGALLAELSLNKKLGEGARVGLFATAGRVLGLVAKTSASVVIAGTTIALALWPIVKGVFA